MDRQAWLAERRAAVEADYTRDAASYDAGYDPATPLHRQFVARLIETTPADGIILDAPCGTGPYIGQVLASRRRVLGADQSSGMLEAARSKHPDVRFELVGLQELAFDGEFDGVMTVDSMEHVPPEEWPLVVSNLRRALKPGGHLYLTCEEAVETELDSAYTEALAAGLPVVRGELTAPDTGGYHYYPGRALARAWLTSGGFEVVDEGEEWIPDDHGGYGYHHLLLRRSS